MLVPTGARKGTQKELTRTKPFPKAKELVHSDFDALWISAKHSKKPQQILFLIKHLCILEHVYQSCHLHFHVTHVAMLKTCVWIELCFWKDGSTSHLPEPIKCQTGQACRCQFKMMGEDDEAETFEKTLQFPCVASPAPVLGSCGKRRLRGGSSGWQPV